MPSPPPYHLSITVRDPDAEAECFLHPSPPFYHPRRRRESLPWLDEAGFIEQNMGDFVSADRTFLRRPAKKEDDDEWCKGDAVVVEVPKLVFAKEEMTLQVDESDDESLTHESQPLLPKVSSPKSPARSPSESSAGSFMSAVTSFKESLHRDSTVSRASRSSSESSGRVKLPGYSKLTVTGEEHNRLETVENYWGVPKEESPRRLNPDSFKVPPKGKSEFDDGALPKGS